MQKPHKLPIPLIASIGSIIVVLLILVIAKIFFAPANMPDPDYLGQFSADTHSEAECKDFMSSLPNNMGNYHKSGNSYLPEHRIEQKIIIRCGITQPKEFKPMSQIELVNGVNWFVLSSDADASQQKSAGLIWVTMDRPMYIAIWIPADASTGPIEDLSQFIARHLPAHKLSQHMMHSMRHMHSDLPPHK